MNFFHYLVLGQLSALAIIVKHMRTAWVAGDGILVVVCMLSLAICVAVIGMTLEVAQRERARAIRAAMRRHPAGSARR